MNYLTISELVTEKLQGQLVSAAFFSTFSFEPDFFELEIMPLLLAHRDGKTDNIYQPALSSNDAIRWQQVERLLASQPIPTAVIYDPSVYRCERSPRLEIVYHGYSIPSGCQHAKLIAFVLEDPITNVQKVIFGAGSFNLTRAGWWDNIECGHFVTLSASWAPKNLCDQITEALEYYLVQMGGENEAINKVIQVIVQLTKTKGEDDLQFYFSGQLEQANYSFADFIAAEECPTEQLEVISPYFAESGDNAVLSKFMSTYCKTRILLPIDPYSDKLNDVKANIEASVYQQLKTAGVDWCQWQPTIQQKLTADSSLRSIHAKVYRMADEERSDVFIGSVNFSFKAFEHNVEAGFLIKQTKVGPFLGENISCEPAILNEAEPELHGGEVMTENYLPALNLMYCWKEKILTLQNHQIEWSQNIVLNSNSDDEPLAEVQVHDGWLTLQAEILDIKALESHLKNSAMVLAHSLVEQERYVSEQLISQRNICMRPSSFPPLRLADLLDIFRDMNQQQLLLLTERYAQVSELAIAYCSGDDSGVEAKVEARNFFSAFSEVNSAFFNLNRKLLQAKNDKDERTIDYYLLGKQVDSLYGVLNAVTSSPMEDSKKEIVLIEPVIRYLTLLSIHDSIQRFGTTNGELFEKLSTAISELESGGELVVTDNNDTELHNRFLAWFKEEFFSTVDAVLVGEEQ
jgi:hypothetical protein